MKNNPENQKIALLWLKKAKEDLLWAKASQEDKFFAGCCFVCQQATEKALKAFLFSKNQILLKTHSLPRLLKECLKFDKQFNTLKDGCEILTLYYTESRYPSDADTSEFDTKESAIEALILTKDILNFIEIKIIY
ncbi:HEPN domain-containing protein [Candidatus Parcubacteria bacterium]|nr:HEPN domain-containing protein [Candidatus Parcubacteria bacterium]